MSHGLLRNRRYGYRHRLSLHGLSLVVGMTITVDIARADSMRCGKHVVNESATVDELLNKCGEPRAKEVTKDDVYLTNTNGARVKTGTVTVTERWIYQPSTRSLPMVVVIVDGKVMSLSRGP